MERTKKRAHLWKKAIAHFSLCFVMGFFTGFFPTGKSNSSLSYSQLIEPARPRFTPHPTESEKSAETRPALGPEAPKKLQRVKLSEKDEPNLGPRKLVIIVTPTGPSDELRGPLLRRMADTIGLVPAPLVWIVVEGSAGSEEANRILRRTGIMYRHLVSKENFTDAEAELEHQRNVALKHIEQHRLGGIVHFAELSNVYDLEFFDELRKIEAFGTWPMALLTANRNKVTIEGPVCDSSQVLGWHLRKINNQTEIDSKPPIHISSFGFNSSILWDPERWGRTSSEQSTSQSSIKFVKQVVLEDESEIKGIPPNGCSKIMLWRLNFPNQNTNNQPPIITTSNDENQR